MNYFVPALVVVDMQEDFCQPVRELSLGPRFFMLLLITIAERFSSDRWWP